MRRSSIGLINSEKDSSSDPYNRVSQDGRSIDTILTIDLLRVRKKHHVESYITAPLNKAIESAPRPGGQ